MSEKGYTLVKYILEMLLVSAMLCFLVAAVGMAYIDLGRQFDDLTAAVQNKLRDNSSNRK